MPRAVAIGECMLELTRQGDGLWEMRHGGDSFNVATYLARSGVPVAYLTALGADTFSDDMRAAWAAEGIDLSLVATVPDRVPGLYAIETDASGERSFTYWRDRSAVRALFESADIDRLLAEAAGCDLLYLSGITLSLFDEAGQHRLADLAQAVRSRGGRVAFDSNYRPRGWASADAARAAIGAFAPLVDIALPTLEDEVSLFGDADADACVRRWLRTGASLVVVKQGPLGALLAAPDGKALIATDGIVLPRDTTGAGDSFNGAFLAALLSGAEPQKAVMAGHRLAATVIQQPGAIIPPEAMPKLEATQ